MDRSMASTPDPASPATIDDHDALPPGTRLAEFEILRVLGVGGFGIVYLALDHSLLRQVALKEFMSGELAASGRAGIVGPRSAQCADQFERALDSFLNEARLLAPEKWESCSTCLATKPSTPRPATRNSA